MHQSPTPIEIRSKVFAHTIIMRGHSRTPLVLAKPLACTRHPDEEWKMRLLETASEDIGILLNSLGPTPALNRRWTTLGFYYDKIKIQA